MQYHVLQKTTPCWDIYLKTSNNLSVGFNMLLSAALKGVVTWLARHARTIGDEMYWMEDSPPPAVDALYQPAVDALYQDLLHMNE